MILTVSLPVDANQLDEKHITLLITLQASLSAERQRDLVEKR